MFSLRPDRNPEPEHSHLINPTTGVWWLLGLSMLNSVARVERENKRPHLELEQAGMDASDQLRPHVCPVSHVYIHFTECPIAVCNGPSLPRLALGAQAPHF